MGGCSQPLPQIQTQTHEERKYTRLSLRGAKRLTLASSPGGHAGFSNPNLAEELAVMNSLTSPPNIEAHQTEGSNEVLGLLSPGTEPLPRSAELFLSLLKHEV